MLCPNERSSPLTSSILDSLSSLRRSSQRIHVRPLSRDPFTNVRRAVSEFGSVRFAECQEFYGIPVHEEDVLEIDGHSGSFLFQQGAKHIHIVRCNPAAD